MKNAIDFLEAAFPENIDGGIYINCLVNRDVELRPGELRRPAEFIINSRAALPRKLEWLFEYDQPRHGLYFGIATRAGRSQMQDACVASSMMSLDIDRADANFEDLLDLDLPPSWINASGHGLHAYWFFDEPTDELNSVSIMNRFVAQRLNGDPAIANTGRILRLPDSHNTKRGGWAPVTVLHADRLLKYPRADLQQWLLDSATQTELDILDAFAKTVWAGSRVDPDKIMLAMTSYGDIPNARRSVVWACIQRGYDPDDVVRIFCDHAMKLEPEGANWSRQTEEQLVWEEINRLESKLAGERT